jgi:Protein of unknown function (DUF3800)
VGFVLVAELTFFADESGIHDPRGEQPGSEVASIAGYIARKREWAIFERRWNTALRKFKIPAFRMSEFNRREQKPDSPYFGWSNEKKKNFLRLLIKIASRIPLAGYGSMVQTKAWDSILDEHTKVGIPTKGAHGAEELYNPYMACFQNFFAKFPGFLDRAVNPLLSRHSPVADVAFVFHRHQDFGPAAQIGYKLSRKILNDDRLGTFTFASSEKCPPLQAADLLAFYSRRRFTRFLDGKNPDEFELRLLEPDPQNSDRVYLVYLSPENLRDLQEHSEKVRAQQK